MNGSILTVRPDQRKMFAEMRSAVRGEAAGGQLRRPEGLVMAGKFEVFVDAEAQYRFRLITPGGGELAVSGAYPDKSAAVAAIEAVRECAGMGLISDLCPAGIPVPAPAPAEAETAAAVQAPVPAACEPRRFPIDGFRKHAAVHRTAAPHLSGVA
jgi:uncharacterized protein YegP (UPF0339 family)